MCKICDMSLKILKKRYEKQVIKGSLPAYLISATPQFCKYTRKWSAEI